MILESSHVILWLVWHTCSAQDWLWAVKVRNSLWCSFSICAKQTFYLTQMFFLAITICYRIHSMCFPVGRNTILGFCGGNPRLSTERRLLLFSHEGWVRIAFRNSAWEPATLEVKGEWSNHYTTEAPLFKYADKWKVIVFDWKQFILHQSIKRSTHHLFIACRYWGDLWILLLFVIHY